MNVKLSDSGLWRTLSNQSLVRVLLIDDSPSDRELYRRHLEADLDRMYSITEASSADDANSLLKLNDYDCMLLDYRLPDVSGLDFLKSIQESSDTAKIPVIVVTGEGDENVAVECLRKGAVDYIPKDKASTGVFQRAIGNAIVQADMQKTIAEQTRNLAKANSELQTRNEEIQRFYHSVSHEIKTPLTATREFIAIVLDGLVGDINERQKEMLSDALDSCDEIANQFNDLVDCTRLETGKLPLKLSVCSVADVIQRSIVLSSPALRDKEIVMKQSLQPNLPKCKMDPGRMVRVISNLLSNAIKHTDTGGTITAFARSSGQAIEIGVRDTGCGIAADQLPKIFDRLYQVSEGNNDLWGVGLGLGLTIAREIVDLHGGKISVKSELGVGSTFTVRLPMSISQHVINREVRTA